MAERRPCGFPGRLGVSAQRAVAIPADLASAPGLPVRILGRVSRCHSSCWSAVQGHIPRPPRAFSISGAVRHLVPYFTSLPGVPIDVAVHVGQPCDCPRRAVLSCLAHFPDAFLRTFFVVQSVAHTGCDVLLFPTRWSFAYTLSLAFYGLAGTVGGNNTLSFNDDAWDSYCSSVAALAKRRKSRRYVPHCRHTDSPDLSRLVLVRFWICVTGFDAFNRFHGLRLLFNESRGTF